MNELALFAGAGGGILGGKLLGWRTVCAVEWEPYPASVLCARQNDGLLPPFPIWDDVQTFDGKPWKGIVDVVSGGFPCQDISAAGKGAGIDGERSGMWGEMARIIHEVRPRYVFVENSPMLTSRGLGRVLGDLASMGFNARWGVLGAADVGANHQRDRIWIRAEAKMANPQSFRDRRNTRKFQAQDEQQTSKRQKGWVWQSDNASQSNGKMGNANNNGQAATEVKASIAKGSDICKAWKEQASESARPSEQYAELADTLCNGLQGGRKDGNSAGQVGLCGREGRNQEQAIYGNDRNWWEAEPNVGRVVDGLASRVDRLKAIGNGQVPLCAATAWRILSE